MANDLNPDVPYADRRGLSPEGFGCNSWWVTLIQVPGATGTADLDAIVARLVERGVVGEHRRDVGEAILAGEVVAPAGRWAVLIALPGQPWAVVKPDDYDTPADLARRSGLRTLGTGHQDTASATGFEVFEGDETLVRYEHAPGFHEDGPDHRLDGTRFPADWIDRLDPETPTDVQDRLAREFDAYVPRVGAAVDFEIRGTGEERITLYGFDGTYGYEPEFFTRVDLIGFGPTQLTPARAGHDLLAAIRAGDVAAIRRAVAAGADLRTLPGLVCSPLRLALNMDRLPDGVSRRDLVATLLDLGADLDTPGEETAIHTAMEDLAPDESDLISVLEVLLDRGAAVDGHGRDLLSRRSTPLLVAARRNWRAVSKFLVSRGADVHATDFQGKTPREVVAEVAEMMKDEGWDDEPDIDRYAPLAEFFADAESGRADWDWAADAEASHRAHLEKQRIFDQLRAESEARRRAREGDRPVP